MQQKVESFDTPPPNYNLNQHAINGFSQRPSAAQVAAYIIIAASIAVYFSSTLPLEDSKVLLTLYIIFGVVMVVSAGMATKIDPTDRVVYYYKWSRHDRKVPFAPEYDKVLFCEFCDSYCWTNSKHCRTCNRCVNDFDHHCMWFNNCVGGRNYWHFFISIISTFAYSLIVALQATLASFNVNYNDSGQLLKIILSWIVALILAVFAFLIINLIILHIYLLLTGQTTYQFLQRKKKEEEEERRQRERERQKLRLQLQPPRKESVSSDQILSKIDAEGEPSPQPKQGELFSEQSFANTKIVMVQSDKGESSEHLQSNRKKNKRKISNDYFEEQLAKHSKKQEQKSAKSNEEEENDVTIIQEEEELNLDESREKLPNFLRKNKSIKLLLSSTHAENPSKKKLNPNSFQLKN